MADDPNEGFKPDVPTGTDIVISTPAEKKAFLARLSGELPPNECRYLCRNCGEDKTLRFDDDEMAALGSNLADYSGPCWKCGTMMLVPYDSIQNGSFKSVHEMASENKKREYGEAADVFLGKVQERIGDMIGGMPAATVAQTDGSKAPDGKTTRDNLPDAADVDLTDMKPRR